VGHGLHEAARQRGHARHALQEVERHPLAAQQRLGRTFYCGQHCSRGHLLAVVHARGKAHLLVQQGKSEARNHQAGHYSLLLGHETTLQQALGGNHGEGGQVTVANVLGECLADALQCLCRL